MLFLFDVIMAFGRITSIKWVHERKVFEGGYCTAQGKLKFGLSTVLCMHGH